MARTALTPQSVSATGTIPTYTAANADGHSVAVGVLVHIKNGSGGTVTLTLPTPGTVEGLAIADRTIAILTGAEVMFRPTGVLRQPDDGAAWVDFDDVTSVTVAAFI